MTTTTTTERLDRLERAVAEAAAERFGLDGPEELARPGWLRLAREEPATFAVVVRHRQPPQETRA